jgi:hypothetical protein
MTAVRAFFRRHLRIHAWIHRGLYTAAGVLIVKDELLEAVGYIPDNALAPKIMGWVLAGAAFSKIHLATL